MSVTQVLLAVVGAIFLGALATFVWIGLSGAIAKGLGRVSESVAQPLDPMSNFISPEALGFAPIVGEKPKRFFFFIFTGKSESGVVRVKTHRGGVVMGRIVGHRGGKALVERLGVVVGSSCGERSRIVA